MLSRPLALVAAFAILASLFLPWLSSPFGENVVPWAVLSKLDAAGAQAILADAKPETIARLADAVVAPPGADPPSDTRRGECRISSETC